MSTLPSDRPVASGCIMIRGAREHNLRSIDLDVPYYRITTLCGLSGSGKSALALDVLRAEGARRYLESFSARARQHLEKIEKPDVERIEGVPPAIATTGQPSSVSANMTVGTTTEIYDYLRMFFAKEGTPHCPSCGRVARRESPETVWEILSESFNGKRVMIGFSPDPSTARGEREAFESEWREKGFHRGIVSEEFFDFDSPEGLSDRQYFMLRLLALASAPQSEEELFSDIGLRNSVPEKKRFFDPSVDADPSALDFDENDGLGSSETEEARETTSKRSAAEKSDDEMEGTTFKDASRFLMLEPDGTCEALTRYLRKRDSALKKVTPSVFFIVSRLTLNEQSRGRVLDAVETAYNAGGMRCWVFVERDEGEPEPTLGAPYELDHKLWTLVGFSRNMRCGDCGVDFPTVTPNLFNPRSRGGACPLCDGVGTLTAFDYDLVFPNRLRSLRDGAIAPWNNRAYRRDLLEFLEIADELGVRTNVPFAELTREEIARLLNGSTRLKYAGVNGFFYKLIEQKYKMHIRAFLANWQRERVCPMCDGSKLCKEALAVKVDDKNIHDLESISATSALDILDKWSNNPSIQGLARQALTRARTRFAFLKDVGLGYLPLDRPLKTLSSGEYRRAALTSALASDLVDMLCVLDEPSNGLHPQDSERLVQALRQLRDRGNTVVVVDNDATVLNASDKIVELGPGAGRDGGQIVFEGTVEELKASPNSLTGSYLTGKRLGGGVPKRREIGSNFIELVGATGRNLKDVSVRFPLGVLCVVTGPSGAGKSSLIQDTLYPALCAKLGNESGSSDLGLPWRSVSGYEQLEEVALIDQTPIGRSPRSNPVSYLKIFDDIRALYAETPEAKARGYTAGYFSFNVDGGRCNVCKGEGYIQVDMQFMADAYVKCPVCGGKRYQRSVLEALYRSRNIAETLDMTAREAFGFFRGQPKIQQKLKRMLDVGLDYLRLGQPATALSGGEAQRLKLAARLTTVRKGACLYILDEPTSGLHYADVVKLLDQLNALVEAGNSVIAIEHNPLVMKAADYIIDMGPGAAEEGGRIVAQGTPEVVATSKESKTAKYIAQTLAQR